MTHHIPRAAAIAIVFVLAACDSTAPPEVATAIDIVSGDDQTAAASTMLAEPLVVRVTNAKGRAATGASVTWLVAEGGGVVSAETTRVGDDGLTQVMWTLGPTPGFDHGVLASIGATEVEHFQARATLAATAGRD